MFKHFQGLKSFVSVPCSIFLFMLSLYCVFGSIVHLHWVFSRQRMTLTKLPHLARSSFMSVCHRPHLKFALNRLYVKRKGWTNTKCARKQSCCETQSLCLACSDFPAPRLSMELFRSGLCTLSAFVASLWSSCVRQISEVARLTTTDNLPKRTFESINKSKLTMGTHTQYKTT